MRTYKQYLQEHDYAISTINSHCNAKSRFIEWCKRNHTSPKEIDYKMCLKFIKYLTRKGNSKKTINHKLRSVKIYLNYLIDEAYRIDNPIEKTTVKGVKRTINYDLLDADELEDLYYSFESSHATDKYALVCAKRNKVITGLIVYQGLNTTSLSKLNVEHLQLSKGKIYIPSTLRSNARELELKPWQIMEFIEYLNNVLPVLQKRMKNHTEQLFPMNTRFNVLTSQIIKKLKKYNQKAENIKQVRASVITNWLDQYNLRQVQYLAGHRYISSTERYVQDDLENLHEIVNNFHPIS